MPFQLYTFLTIHFCSTKFYFSQQKPRPKTGHKKHKSLYHGPSGRNSGSWECGLSVLWLWNQMGPKEIVLLDLQISIVQEILSLCLGTSAPQPHHPCPRSSVSCNSSPSSPPSTPSPPLVPSLWRFSSRPSRRVCAPASFSVCAVGLFHGIERKTRSLVNPDLPKL